MPSYIKISQKRKGRPVVSLNAVSATSRAQFLSIYRETGSVSEARRRSKITADELERLKQECPEFAAEFHAAKMFIQQNRLDLVLDRMFEAAMKGDSPAGRFLLSKLRPEEFGDKPAININIGDISKMTDEELADAVARCQGKKS